MRKANPIRASFNWLLILFCLSFQSNSMANSIEFDAGFSEFILKNSPALIAQIKQKSGVGFSSLKNQLALKGCDASILEDEALTEQQDSYAFFRYLMDKVNRCSTGTETSETQDFAGLLKGKTPYLLIAGESLNAPMSYFGHSLLLFLDEEDFYFSPVLSVLAPLESKQLFSQTLKGGFSSIKAEINLTPLHQVISFYNNYESRSLRFIKLPKDQFDGDKLINYFDQALTEPLAYNFFLQNCATYIYRALDHACDCLDEELDIISPALMEAQLHQVASRSEVFELPSLLSLFNQKYQVLTNFEQHTVQQMVQDQDFQYQGMHQDLGDVAVLASRLSFETYKTPYPSYFGLLDTYGNPSGLLSTMPEAGPISDTEKDSLKLSSIALKADKDGVAASFALIDYNQFYQRPLSVNGASLKAASVSVTGIDESSQIDDLTLLEINTLKPINFVSKAFSWRLKLGAERDHNDELAGLARYGLGPTVTLLGANFYLLPSVEISNTSRLPVYSGFESTGGFVSFAYENKDLEDHSLKVFKRINSDFSLEYQVVKEVKEAVTHSASAFYYF